MKCTLLKLIDCDSGIILCMSPANDRWRYNVTSSIIGWAHIQNDPCDYVSKDTCPYGDSVAVGHLNIKVTSFQYRDSHYKDKTVSWPSYLYNGNHHTRKDGLETGPYLFCRQNHYKINGLMVELLRCHARSHGSFQIMINKIGMTVMLLKP